MTPRAGTGSRVTRRWLARAVFLLMVAAAVVLAAGSGGHGGGLLLAVLVCLVVVLAATYWFLAHRGWVRTAALVLLVSAPLVAAVLVVRAGLLTVLLAVAVLLLLAVVAGRAALAPDADHARMPEHRVPPPRHPFLVMNPRSGGGKVGRFGLREKAEALGAEVALLDGPDVDVVVLARDAVARGADLLGVAGGDGTQALVAGVAADLDVPFLVVTAGTRNHFALDLGLDRADPAACLDALTEEAVELHVDLGVVAGRTFVNNASFGAYAAVVQSPQYRDGKTRTTLGLLPELLSGQTGSRLTVWADGLTVDHPQAVLVSVNPYGMGDVAGLGRRARLDTGELGMVAVNVDSARQAVGLLRRTRDHGLTAQQVPEVVVTSDAPRIPVGVDGEAVMLETPVTCTVRPQALRVRVPRHRPGVPSRRPPWSWIALWRLAWAPGPGYGVSR